MRSFEFNYLLYFVISTFSNLFLRMFCNICSLNSICKKDANILSNLMNLFLNGLNAVYLLFFNLTIWVLLVLLFFVVYIFLLLSSNIVNEILGLFDSKSEGVMLLKLYLFSNGFSFDILGEKRYYSNVKKLILSI